jgi:hypothetical protein
MKAVFVLLASGSFLGMSFLFQGYSDVWAQSTQDPSSHFYSQYQMDRSQLEARIEDLKLMNGISFKESSQGLRFDRVQFESLVAQLKEPDVFLEQTRKATEMLYFEIVFFLNKYSPPFYLQSDYGDKILVPETFSWSAKFLGWGNSCVKGTWQGVSQTGKDTFSKLWNDSPKENCEKSSKKIRETLSDLKSGVVSCFQQPITSFVNTVDGVLEKSKVQAKKLRVLSFQRNRVFENLRLKQLERELKSLLESKGLPGAKG